MMRITIATALSVLAGACSSPARAPSEAGADSASAPRDAGTETSSRIDSGRSDDGAPDAPDAENADAGTQCSVDGEPGVCMEVSACAELAGYTSTPGFCPGPADVECCRLTPNVADNPPTPTGYELMPQSAVTPDMTTWAVAILGDPAAYPLFATTTRVFGSLTVLARVEWHPPDFQNSVVHRGVTLYQPR